MLIHLYEQTLYKMYGIWDREQLTANRQAVVVDKVYVEEDGELEDVLFFHIFGKKVFLYVISMKVQPMPNCVGILLSSSIVI